MSDGIHWLLWFEPKRALKKRPGWAVVKFDPLHQFRRWLRGKCGHRHRPALYRSRRLHRQRSPHLPVVNPVYRVPNPLANPILFHVLLLIILTQSIKLQNLNNHIANLIGSTWRPFFYLIPAPLSMVRTHLSTFVPLAHFR